VSERTPARDLAIGIGVGLGAIALVFFGSVAALEIATLTATAAGFIWFATVDAARLVDPDGRPSRVLFLLAVVAVALLLTAAVFIATLTEYLATVVGIVAVVTGMVRAVGHGWTIHRPEE
jgi:hypothetical protein